jgi:hypothetical protein
MGTAFVNNWVIWDGLTIEFYNMEAHGILLGEILVECWRHQYNLSKIGGEKLETGSIHGILLQKRKIFAVVIALESFWFLTVPTTLLN